LPGSLLWFWAPDGRVYDVSAAELLAHQRAFEIDFDPSRPAIWPDLEQALDTIPIDDPVFLLALHGGEGEDGSVQRLLEKRGLPFTGSGSEPSAVAFDKARAKEILQGNVPLAESRVARSSDELRRAATEMLERHEKLVLKPLAGGSSRGLFFVDRHSKTADIDVPYIVEQFIAGRELTVGVIERDGAPLALPVIEIEVDPGREFDYAGKYLGHGTREICPANIPDELRDAAQQTAVAAHIALGCEGYSRSDLIAAGDGVYFLEVNTLPGLTATSLVPQQLATAGIEFREFLEEQLEIANRRRPRLSDSAR
jgi:D-alanine-D-alanine ligase